MTPSKQRLALLSQHSTALKGILRGIEKEGLRVDLEGKLATTPHPTALGSALAHPSITTDYSEALLELITHTHGSADDLMQELLNTHCFVAQQMPDELMWNQSMPAWLPAEADIPIGWYGNSNTGMLKHVYRKGLAERYGKAMQCIAGVHYNFSLPDQLWDALGAEGISLEDQRSKGYMALIRNFMRYSWLLMYLFGASPAVSKRFVRNLPHTLETLDEDTMYLPWATSLRMSDIGYQNKAQSELQLCYNDLETFLTRMHTAVTTPWPEYEAIGTHRNGEWIQLSTNILQIENEYYSNIRPKRTTGRCQRPATALAELGIQYVEVRCLDIDPYSPIGMSVETSRFLDTFLLFCAAEPSRLFPDNGFCKDSRDNFDRVVSQGRKPDLTLINANTPISLRNWASELTERMEPYAELLDQAYGGSAHKQALKTQQRKVADPDLTPSAQLLRDLRQQKLSLHDFTLQQSLQHRNTLQAYALSPEKQHDFLQSVQNSFVAQQQLEEEDTIDFSGYVAKYHAALKPL